MLVPLRGLATGLATSLIGPFFVYACASGLGFLGRISGWAADQEAPGQDSPRPARCARSAGHLHRGRTQPGPGDGAHLRNWPSSRSLCDELTWCGAGAARRTPPFDTWKHLAERTDVDCIRNLVSMLVQSEQFGTSIGKTLRTHSDTLRTQRVQQWKRRRQRPPSS
jgi:hypothetical protein